jgi:hypothetical protein
LSLIALMTALSKRWSPCLTGEIGAEFGRIDRGQLLARVRYGLILPRRQSDDAAFSLARGAVEPAHNVERHGPCRAPRLEPVGESARRKACR